MTQIVGRVWRKRSEYERRMAAIRTALGGAPAEPTAPAGMIAQYDFSDISTLFTDTSRTTPVTADGNSIGGVSDKSGNAFHLTQGTGTAKPTYKTGIVNSRSIARLDSGDFLIVPEAVWEGRSSVRAFIVAQMAANADKVLLACYATGTNERQYLFRRDSSNNLNLFFGGTTGNIQNNTSTTYSDTAQHIWESLGTNGAGGRIFVDGTEASYSGQQNGATLQAELSQDGAIGAFDGSGGTIQSDFDLCEVLIYAAPDASTVTAIRAYLKSKWATP